MSDIKKNGIIQSSTFYEKLTPPEYEDLEYIESTGTQYIDTLLTITDVDEMYANITIKSISNYNYFLGTRNSSSYNNFLCYTSSRFYIQYKSSSSDSTIIPTINTNYKIRSILKNNNQKLFINDELQFETTIASALSDTNTMYLFSVNNTGGGSKYYFIGIAYNVELYKNGILVRNFIPVRRISDSVIGMYDLVNKIFYTNAGTGTFIAGPTVQNNKVMIKQDLVSGDSFIEY